MKLNENSDETERLRLRLRHFRRHMDEFRFRRGGLVLRERLKLIMLS